MKFLLIFLFFLNSAIAGEYQKCISSFLKYPVSNHKSVHNYCMCLENNLPKEKKMIGDLFKPKDDIFFIRDKCMVQTFVNIEEIFDSRFELFFRPFIRSKILESFSFNYLEKIKNTGKILDCMLELYSYSCSRQKSLLTAYRCIKDQFSHISDNIYRYCIDFKLEEKGDII